MLQELTIRAALLRGFEQVSTGLGLDTPSLLNSVNIDRRYLRDPEARISAFSASKLL